MKPSYVTIRLPESGFTSLDGICDATAAAELEDSLWLKGSAHSLELYLYREGPSGSGRFWTVLFGVGPQGSQEPERGVCLLATTVGWRTLLEGLPRPWLDDVDGDGADDLIIWDSFELLRAGDTQGGPQAIIGWVYRIDPQGELQLDWSASRLLARELAGQYRLRHPLPIPESDRRLMVSRSEAARQLDLFAEGQCFCSEVTSP